MRSDLLGLAARSLDVMLTAAMDSLMLRACVAARAHRYPFNTAALPKAVDFWNNAPAFYLTQMREAF